MTTAKVFSNASATTAHAESLQNALASHIVARGDTPLTADSIAKVIVSQFTDHNNPNVLAAKVILYMWFKDGTALHRIGQKEQIMIAEELRWSFQPAEGSGHVTVGVEWLEGLLLERERLTNLLVECGQTDALFKEVVNGPKSDNPALFKSVETLNLPVRVQNGLINCRIDLIWQLVEKTESELEGLRSDLRSPHRPRTRRGRTQAQHKPGTALPQAMTTVTITPRRAAHQRLVCVLACYNRGRNSSSPFSLTFPLDPRFREDD